MTNDTSLESSFGLLLEFEKKFANLQKLIFYRKIQLYSKNVCKKKICPKNEKLYIFEKPLTMPFQIFAKNCKKFAIFFRKTCAIRFLMS